MAKIISSGMLIILPGFLVHRPTGFHLVSPLVRQCFLQSTDVVRCFFMTMIKMPLQFYSYGSADFVDGMNQEVFTRVQECVSVYLFVLFLVSFKSLVFVFHWKLYANSLVLHTFSFKFCKFCQNASIPVRSGGWNVPNDQRHASATSSDVYLG